MPGGNSTVTPTPLDLGSFLQRKRKTLHQWLKENGITTETALEAFLTDPIWSVSLELVQSIRDSLKRPIEAKQEVIIPPAEEESSPSPLPLTEELIEESVIETFPTDGISHVSRALSKERKKSK